MTTVRRWWSDYAEKVIPVDAPPVQMRECKRAFYAGAAAFLDAMMSGLSPDTGAPTDDEMAHMERLHNELVDFGNAVKTGKA